MSKSKRRHLSNQRSSKKRKNSRSFFRKYRAILDFIATSILAIIFIPFFAIYLFVIFSTMAQSANGANSRAVQAPPIAVNTPPESNIQPHTVQEQTATSSNNQDLPDHHDTSAKPLDDDVTYKSQLPPRP